MTIEQVFDGAYVKSVVDTTDPAQRKTLWTITERTPDGALRAGRFGDSIATYEAQYDAMGQPRRIQARRGFSDFLMDLEVTPDANGNVKRREDHAAQRVETFAYDKFHRLRHWSTTNGGITVARELRYDLMSLQILKDAKERLDLFVWMGPVDADRLRAWCNGSRVQLHPELEYLLTETGGGDMFESETILSPFGGHATGDNAVEANEFHRERGLPKEFWLFHVGIVLSAIDQRNGRIVTLTDQYAVHDEYESLEEWYVTFLRDEYAERYGLRSLARHDPNPPLSAK